MNGSDDIAETIREFLLSNMSSVLRSIEPPDYEQFKSNLDQMFLISNGMIVLFMQCGFAFLEAGAVRSKNSTNILIKNFLDVFVSGSAYWLFGYAFAFGSKANSFIGYSNFAAHEMADTDYAFFFFQYVFAATAATIVSGAVAERCHFLAYLVYSFVLTSFIYPVVTHWAWSGEGWLAHGQQYTDTDGAQYSVKYTDFAGSGVVHAVGGTAALCAALLLGPRLGRFQDGQVIPIRGHSVPLVALGGFILVFGFMAFNGGSQASMSSPGDGAKVAIAVMNTVISGSISGLFTLVLNKLSGNDKWSLLMTINGSLTGMVAICAGCDAYHTWGAAVVGAVAALVYKLWSFAMLKLKIDDPLDATAVHLGGGSWGVIAVAFLKQDDGILLNWGEPAWMGLAWQCLGFAAIVAWTAVLCLVMFGILRMFNLLRVSEEVEHKGLDIPKHGEPAYPLESYGHGWIESIGGPIANGKGVPCMYPSQAKHDHQQQDGGHDNHAAELQMSNRSRNENPDTNLFDTKMNSGGNIREHLDKIPGNDVTRM